MEKEQQSITNEDIYNALTTLNSNTSATNDSIKELTAYLVAKDKKEQEETAKEEKLQAEKDEQQAQEDEQALAESTAKADAQTETYTELLTTIKDNVDLTNHLLSGQIFFMGALLGVLLIKILFDRFSTRL